MGGSGGQDGGGHARADQDSVESEGTGALNVRHKLVAEHDHIACATTTPSFSKNRFVRLAKVRKMQSTIPAEP
jgi:hypothetical protein